MLTLRQYIWHHNSLRGHSRMMYMNAQSIIDSPSTNTEAKQIAKEIQNLSDRLNVALKTRIDP